MIVFFLALFCYLAASFFIASKIDAEKVRSWFLLIFLSLIVVSVEFLGALQIFRAETVVGLGIAWLVGCGLFEWYGRRNGHKTVAKNLAKTARLNWLQRLDGIGWWLLMGGIFLATFFYSQLVPLAEIDSMGYHLPIVTQLLDTGSLWNVFHAAYVGPNTFFPANHEMLQAFVMIFTNSINLNYLITLLGFLLFYQALADLTRQRKISKSLLFLSILAVAVVPFLFKQLLNFQVDLFLFFLFGSAVAWLFSAFLNDRSGGGRQDLAKFFLVLGLVIGTKYNGLPQSVMLIPLILAVFFHYRKSLQTILWMPLLSLLTGGFWYIRNWIVAGNPMYPFQLHAGPIQFEGYKNFNSDLVGTSILNFVQKNGWKPVENTILHHVDFSNLVGLSTLGFLLLSGILAGILTIVLIRKTIFQKGLTTEQKVLNGFGLVLILFLIYLFCAEVYYYASSPYTFTLWNQTVRYASSIFALLPLLFALVLYYWRWSWVVLWPALGSFFGYELFFKNFVFQKDYLTLVAQKLGSLGGQILLLFAALILLGGVAWWLIMNSKKKIYCYLLVGGFALMMGLYQFQIFTSLPRNIALDDAFLTKKFTEYPELLPFLQILRAQSHVTSPKIGLVGLITYWLFSKEGYQPLYVNIDGCAKCKYYDYHQVSIRANPDPVLWKKALLDLGVRYLMVKNIHENPNDSMEEATWADSDPSLFQPLFTTDRLKLYQITPSDGA